MSVQNKLAAVSSVLLRLFSYIFLRWIPGNPISTIIYTLFAIYVPAALSSFFSQPAYDVVADDIDVTIRDREVADEPIDTTTAATQSVIKTHIEEEIKIDETIVLQQRSSKPWRTLLTGLPSPTSALLSLLTFLINAALVLAVTDLVYRGRLQYPSTDLSFARVGYVSNTEAKLLVREPDESKWPVHVEVRIKDAKPPFDMPGWQDMGGVNFFKNDTDFTAALPLVLREGKQTDYEWRTSNGHNGSFKGGPQSGQKLLERRTNTLSFLTSSCIIPKFPYNPMEHPLAIPGFRHLAKLLPKLNPQFMLFLGDFIYIDVPKRFGVTTEDYRREYRQIYASPDWPSVSNLSWIHVLDDHEIANDYDLGPDTAEFKAASDPFHHYQAAVNPAPARKSGSPGNQEVRHGATWYEFDSGPAMFFMMDTRKHRDKNHEKHVNSTSKSMLGGEQLQDLLLFLERPIPVGVRWKIVISSIPFTQNWGGPSGKDTWAGFLDERQKILEAMWTAGVAGAGVVVLSGDRHEFAATAFPPPPNSSYPEHVTVHEYSTSPLSQFYLPIPTYRETLPSDKLVKYIPHGNSKFGHIEIETPEKGDVSEFTFVLYVDGKETWRDVLLSPRVGKTIKERVRDVVWSRLEGVMGLG